MLEKVLFALVTIAVDFILFVLTLLAFFLWDDGIDIDFFVEVITTPKYLGFLAIAFGLFVLPMFSAILIFIKSELAIIPFFLNIPACVTDVCIMLFIGMVFMVAEGSGEINSFTKVWFPLYPILSFIYSLGMGIWGIIMIVKTDKKKLKKQIKKLKKIK